MENTETSQVDNSTMNNKNKGNKNEIPKKDKNKKSKRTTKSIVGTILITLGSLSILSILLITYLFLKGDIEIIISFFSITALLILTSSVMFFGNVILTLDEKEKSIKKWKIIKIN